MIQFDHNVFHITTANLSYLIGIREEKYLEHLYFGQKIKNQKSFEALYEKMGSGYGNSIVLPNNDKVTLDNICLEFVSSATGDFRHTSMELRMPDGSYSNRFEYADYKIYSGIYKESALTRMPYARDVQGADVKVADSKKIESDSTNHSQNNGKAANKAAIHTLEIRLIDAFYKLEVSLIYTAFEACDVITRRCVLKNKGEKSIVIEKLMSMQLDLCERDYDLDTFDGLWTRERHKKQKELVSGIYVNDSTTGNSSNRHNPLILLSKKDCNEHAGECLGVNLIYSGNHYEAVEVSEYEKIRIMSGMNPYRFEWHLEAGECFYTPEAILTYSKEGKNGLSQKFHHFVERHIIPKEWSIVERSILINNWEATYFDFNESKLLRLAREAKELGIELFVLDDGWFGNRSDDTSSLGDWEVNEKKLGGTLKNLVKKINDLDLKFGLWLEPEMISENSKLFERHPDWAVTIEGREHFQGRNQMVLDYTKQEVRDYIVTVVSGILKDANVEYVKWDMNRQITDAYSKELGKKQGEFYHRFILGLYEVMHRIVSKFPNILFESCASGGNRFDLGMLFYMPQTWTSDNTDANERIMIQEGTSYGYPLSTMGAHVSAVPNHQTLRMINLETRFQVACFGVLGYELDLTKLTKSEKKAIKAQIAFYKEHRALFQFGTFTRNRMHNGNVVWQVVSEDKSEAIVLVYQQLTKPNQSSDVLKIKGLEEDVMYEIATRKQFISIKEFGSLVNHVSPVAITQGGVMQSVVDKVFMLESEEERYQATGGLLEHAGIKLLQKFVGVGYNSDIRVMGDFSSRLYVVKKIEG